MVERTHLEEGFRKLGLTTGDAVEVHSSLSRFGRVAGGAATVVDALMAVVGSTGAIVMPAAPLLSDSLPVTPAERARGIKFKCKVLTPDEAPTTGMGAIVDEFLARPGVVVGPGMYRVCAWGRDADRHPEGFGHLLEMGGKGLLLGVGINRLSSMHNPEHEIGVPEEIRAHSALPADLRRDYPEAEWYVECEQVKGHPGDPWGRVWKEAVEKGLVTTREIGKSTCHCFRVADVIGIHAHYLRTDPWTHFGVPRPGCTREEVAS